MVFIFTNFFFVLFDISRYNLFGFELQISFKNPAPLYAIMHLTNETLSDDTKVNDLVTFTFDLHFLNLWPFR